MIRLFFSPIEEYTDPKGMVYKNPYLIEKYTIEAYQRIHFATNHCIIAFDDSSVPDIKSIESDGKIIELDFEGTKVFKNEIGTKVISALKLPDKKIPSGIIRKDLFKKILVRNYPKFDLDIMKKNIYAGKRSYICLINNEMRL